jgi:hypothetical protein
VLYWAARRPSLAVLALIIVIGTFVGVTAPSSSTTATIVLGLVVVALLVSLALLLVNLSGSDPDAERRARLAVGDDPASVALLGRWLRRSRHFRFVGGLAGFILQFGVVGYGVSVASLTLGVLGGVAAGGALAEVHSWRRRHGPRVADLTRRRLRDYVRLVDVVAVGVVAAAALGLLITGLIDRDRADAGPAAVVALVVVAVLVATLRLVVLRPRPALDPTLREADELMRRLAATRGFTRPAIAVAIALVAVALDAAGVGSNDVGLLWLVALGWYVASRQSESGLRRARLR